MSDQKLVWLLIGGGVTLSALLLWLRDRFRDFRHVPEAERKRDEQRSLIVVPLIMSSILAAFAVYDALKPGDMMRRVVAGVVAVGIIMSCWTSLKQYRKIGSKR